MPHPEYEIFKNHVGDRFSGGSDRAPDAFRELLGKDLSNKFKGENITVQKKNFINKTKYLTENIWHTNEPHKIFSTLSNASHGHDHIVLPLYFICHKIHELKQLADELDRILDFNGDTFSTAYGWAPTKEFSFDTFTQALRSSVTGTPPSGVGSDNFGSILAIGTASNLDQNPSAQTPPRIPENDEKGVPLSSPSAPFEWPPYVSEEDARSPNAHEGIWLNPFNHYSIPFSHRQAEKARLDAFMKDDRPFLICALVASSGAGKTRLVSEWMRPYVPVDGNDTDWDAGFVRSRHSVGWKEWEITRKTLIVIDYTYGYEKVMRAITEKCLRHGGAKVRVLVVDHVYPDILHDDFFWGSSFADQKRIDGHKSRVLFEASPIEIKAEKKNSRFIREIIATAARTEAREFSPDDAPIIAAEKILDRMAGDTGAGHPDAVRHPLFAALLGQAIRDSKRDISNWSRRDLIRHYFDRRTRLPWVQSDDNPHAATIGIWVGAYVSIATLLRGVNFSDLEENLPKAILSDRSPIRLSSVAAQSANRIVSSSDLEILKPFEPDILGENFLILFLQEVKNANDLISSFIDMIHSIFINDDQEKYALNFIETIQKLVRNILNDDQKLREIRNTWSTLLHFLNPVRFPGNSLLRYAASVSCADVIRQGRDSLDARLVNRFADRVDVADLHAASAGSLWRQSCIALVHYHDWQTSQGRLKGDEADTLFASLASFKDRSKTRWPALMLAAHEGCLDSAKAIHSYFAEDVNTSQSEGWTMLMVAANRGQTRIAEWLLGLGAQVNLTRIDVGWTALMAACAAGHTETAALLLDREAEVDQGTTDTGWTALMAACAAGHTETAALLLDREAEVDQGTTDTGWTALMAASREGHTETAALLLDRGAAVNQGRTDDGWTALMAACAAGHTETAALLLDREAEVDQGTTDTGWTALMAACEAGHTETAALLLDRKAEVNQGRTDTGWTALMAASREGHTETATLLLNWGADPDIVSTDNGLTALMIACQAKKHQIAMDILNKSSASINASTRDGTHALFISTNVGDLKMIRIIVSYNVDVDKQGRLGFTAFHMASGHGNTEIMSTLIENRADINKTTDDGISALMLASAMNQIHSVEFILRQENIKINAIDSEGHSALDHAYSKWYSDVAMILHGLGAKRGIDI